MIRTFAAAAAAAGLLMPGAVGYGTRPPENPVCRPLAHTIEHWLPILDRAAPHAIPTGPHSWTTTPPWTSAAGAIAGYIPRGGRWLPRWEGQAATAIVGLGIGPPHMNVADQRANLREALRHISYLCPSLPRSVAEGPLPR